MPELPEVETIRRDLSKVLLRVPIINVEVRKPKMVRGSVASFKKLLRGQSIVDIDRRGKLLMFALNGSKHYLLLHLKMTGQLIYQTGTKVIAGGHPWPPLSRIRNKSVPLPNQYTHLIFSFKSGAKLYFNDLRQFGYVQFVSAEQKQLIEATYGIEPLMPEYTLEAFRAALRGRQTALKNALLNQAVIAGLGNIYVDESCYVAGVRPSRRADRLSHEEVTKLYRATKQIIAKAIKHRGTTFSDYQDARGQSGNYTKYLKVYGRVGESCRRCQTKILRTKINGRGTAYCPVCQK